MLALMPAHRIVHGGLVGASRPMALKSWRVGSARIFLGSGWAWARRAGFPGANPSGVGGPCMVAGTVGCCVGVCDVGVAGCVPSPAPMPGYGIGSSGDNGHQRRGRGHQRQRPIHQNGSRGKTVARRHTRRFQQAWWQIRPGEGRVGIGSSAVGQPAGQ